MTVSGGYVKLRCAVLDDYQELPLASHTTLTGTDQLGEVKRADRHARA
jgi:hypothetical protein